MRIILSGYGGHMGREVRACAERMEDALIVAGVDPMAPADEICVKSIADCKTEADVIIDFSHHSGTGALLEYAVLESLPEGSLVSVRLLTGRSHQIRVQFASRGLPLAGDGRYGAKTRGAIALWSHTLAFPHPRSGETLRFSAPPPASPPWELFHNKTP